MRPVGRPCPRPSVTAAGDFPPATPYRLRRLAALGLPLCVPASLVTGCGGTGFSTRSPSPTARALGLGPTHPQRISRAAEPSGIRWGGFPPPSRYSYRHSHFHPLHRPSPGDFAAEWNAPLPSVRRTHASVASVVGLNPVGLSAPRHTRPVSYYALFQGWLLLSQPPGCLRAATSFATEPTLGDLSRRSGLFPSRRRIFAPAVSLPGIGPAGIRRLPRDGRLGAP